MLVHFALGKPLKSIDAESGAEEWSLLCKCQENDEVFDRWFHFDLEEFASKFSRDVNSNIEGLNLEEED